MTNDNPQYLWGRKNPNWSGPTKANSSANSSVLMERAASADFSPASIERAAEATAEYLSDYLGEAISDGRVSLYHQDDDKDFSSLDEFTRDYKRRLAESNENRESIDGSYYISMDFRQDGSVIDTANYDSLSPSLQMYCPESEPNVYLPLSVALDDYGVISELSDVAEQQQDSPVLDEYWYDQAVNDMVEDIADDEPMRDTVVGEIAYSEFSSREDDGEFEGMDDEAKMRVYSEIEEAYDDIITSDDMKQKVRQKFESTSSLGDEFSFGDDDWHEYAFQIVSEKGYPNTDEIIQKHRDASMKRTEW